MAVLTGIFSWRLYVLLFRIVLQPDVPPARLCDMGDDEARGMYFRISVMMLLIIVWRTLFQVLAAIGTPLEALGAYQVIGVVAYLTGFIWLVFGSREAARQWFGGLGKVAPLAGLVGRNWIPVATCFFVALGATQIYSAVSGRVYVANAMLLTLNLVVGVLIFETLMQAFVRRLDSQLVGLTPASDTPKLPDVVARCIRVAVLIGVAVTIAESWVVQVFAWRTRANGIRSPVRRVPPASLCSWPSCCGSCSSTAPIPTWSARPRARPRRSSTGTRPARRHRASAP